MISLPKNHLLSAVSNDMEKSPAACAMDWSIQLEKSLRSQKPGKSTEALEEIGKRLEWWTSESELSFAEFRMFGLIPGEDKLFLNAIFLRLADAFRLGNKQVKSGVVKLFLRMKRRKRDGEGILSKGKLENYLELLSRVKEAFYKGDVEDRALALRLFGCWANFAKDCADIRYILLSSLVSGDVLEMRGLNPKTQLGGFYKNQRYTGRMVYSVLNPIKHAGFEVFVLEMTATWNGALQLPLKSLEMKISGVSVENCVTKTPLGCLSELSDDFANVFLEILTTMVLSREISRDIKLAGLKLLLDSSEDDFSTLMLISLSRIASRWMLLIPTQIELLALFQTEERSLHMQATSLRCYHIVSARGVCSFPSTTGTVNKLFGILHRSELQPTLQLEALRVLHKILLFDLSIIPCTEIPELFLKLLAVVKNVLQSSIMSTRVLAVSVLADLSGKVLGRVDMVSGGTGRTLASQMISFVFDHILSLVKPKVAILQAHFAAELEVKCLLNTLFNLVEKHSYLHLLALNNICLFIDKLMKMLKTVMETEKTGLSNHEMAKFDNHVKTLFESKLMLNVSKIIAACLQNLEEADAETSQVLDALKLQSQNVCHCSYFDSYTSVAYFLLLHFLSTFICMWHTSEKLMSLSRNSSLSYVDSILQPDKFTLDCAKKMLGTNTYWYLYKAGKTAACQGAWSTAAFIFEELITVVQSASCSCWLKSLAQFSTAEKQIQFNLLPDHGTSVFRCESSLGKGEDIASSTNYCNFMENLQIACNTISSAQEILAASDTEHKFSFQRWFLTLRANTLKTVVDMIKLQDTLVPCITSQTLGPLLYSSTEVSCRMKKLAREFDLLLTSFMGLDRQSVTSVSALALSCSLMAFTAGFAFLVPNLHSSGNYRISEFGNLEEPFHALLIEDLFGRLRHIDCKTRKNLLVLLKSFSNYKGCFSRRFQNQNTCTSYEAVVLHKLTEYSVGEIFGLQNEANGVQQDGEAVSRILNNGSQLLLNIISKLMLVPFHTPHHFFRVRPAVCSEIIVMNEDGQMVDGSSILSGFHLSLNLSFQLKNKPASPPGPLNKAYCILNCKAHSQKTIKIGDGETQARLSWHDHEINDMMDLNEKLLRYVTGSVQTHYNDLEMVNEYVRFELNERGQGFSTCLLDVSSFPVGSYRIKWHSGCIDSAGSYWSILPANSGPLFTIRDVIAVQ
ncbi:hypothetical protein DH2020_020428 [Rehmannia glutinosa]|uniref:Integrator complex subunit 7 n=1 Tax=Rehmannia glutinosa TaxID=99300 RepID=A0ABR0WHK7_REHGL